PRPGAAAPLGHRPSPAQGRQAMAPTGRHGWRGSPRKAGRLLARSEKAKTARLQVARSVPKRGLEPRRAFAHYALNVARLPIPPLRQGVRIISRAARGRGSLWAPV